MVTCPLTTMRFGGHAQDPEQYLWYRSTRRKLVSEADTVRLECPTSLSTLRSSSMAFITSAGSLGDSESCGGLPFYINMKKSLAQPFDSSNHQLDSHRNLFLDPPC